MQHITLRKRLIAAIVLCSVLFLFALFYAVACGKIDVYRLAGQCGFRQKYDLTCPTCGMTSSVVAFVKGRIFEAFYLQPASALLCCILVIVAVLAFVISVFGIDFGLLSWSTEQLKLKHVILTIIIVLACSWAVTLARALAQKN